MGHHISSPCLSDCFARLRAENRAAFVAFVSCCDPDPETALEFLCSLPQAGVDIIELGMPFSDPMADGPTIQASSQRALQAGYTPEILFDHVKHCKAQHPQTPIILFGYFNPILHYGIERFVNDAKTAEADGFLIVDLPFEMDSELRVPAQKAGLSIVRLLAPTTPPNRQAEILGAATGFVYYVSVTGITGAASPEMANLTSALEKISAQTSLPVVAGFGIRTPEMAAEIAQQADGVVVGSAIIATLASTLDSQTGRATQQTIPKTLSFVKELSVATKCARTKTGV